MAQILNETFSDGTDLRKSVPQAKFDEESADDVKKTVDPQKSTAISNAIKLASPGVVGIYKYQDVIKKDLFFRRYQDRIRSIGSGFLISQDGYIITNAHNIELENYETTGFKVTVVLPGGEVYDAEFRGVDVTTDIALL